MAYTGLEDWADDDDRESAKQFVPDTFDPCPCASGKKFKFCCKPGFGEMVAAVAAAAHGRINAALGHIAKAKSVLGETAEVLCREALVYSYFDMVKFRATVERASQVNPDHPRVNYIRGIELKNQGDFKGAIAAYQKAIEHYPKTDRCHLNETYNNLGTAYFEQGSYAEARAAWEQALTLLPSDKAVRQNLNEFIYGNPDLPDAIRRISPFIEKFKKR